MSKSTAVDPHRDLNLEADLDRRGIAWEFRGDYPVADIDIKDESIQVRLLKERAPKEAVEAYATAMRGGKKFPGVVLTADGRLVDGNTRIGAKIKAKQEYTAAYLLSGVSDDVLRTLAIELNQTNGNRMSEEAVKRQMLAYVQAHPDEDPQIAIWATRTGYSTTKLTKWVRVANFDLTARKHGIDVTDPALSESAKDYLMKLGSVTLMTAVADLIISARLSAREADIIIKDVLNGAKESEGEALTRVAAQRTALADRIASGGILGRRPNPLTSHKMHLAYIINRVKPSDLAHAMTDTERNAAVEQMRQAVNVLNAAIAAAEAADQGRSAA